MSGTRAPPGHSVNNKPYQDFQGIDASRDRRAMDTPSKQHFVTLENGYADWRGVLQRDPGATKRGGDRIIENVAFFGRDLACWAEIDGAGINLSSDRGHSVTGAYRLNDVTSSVVFNRRTLFCARQRSVYSYNGLRWERNNSAGIAKPAFMAAVQSRLAAAGFQDRPTVVDLSRVDDDNIWPPDEKTVGATDVLRAATIDIKNFIGVSDEIKGLGVFELDKLVIFTNDRAVVYTIDPNVDKWQVEPRANIQVGTISHNTICNANTDLLFCSRFGVHSMRRSEYNSLSIFSVPMSAKIERLYRALYRSVPNPESVRAVWDQDEGQYHIFFPQAGGVFCRRLTMTITPIQGAENRWSTADFLNARCGFKQSGKLLYGTSGGIYDLKKPEDTDAEVLPKMTAKTPILWLGSLTDVKETSVITIQATGRGTLKVIAFNEEDRKLGEIMFPIEDASGDDPPLGVPLSRQYDRKFEYQAKGFQLQFEVQGSGDVKIIGFAIGVKN
jgi:hypothetical protein